MERIFKEHVLRKTELLNGEWKFCIDSNNVGINEKWYEEFPNAHRYANIPSCWNLELDLFDYFGIAWYSKEFYCEECYLQVEFGAVSGLATVYLDGDELGDHYGGWTAFRFAKMVKGGKHTLTVRVDASSNNINTLPLERVDWYHYGGIIRSVEISQFKTPYINRHKISYKLDSKLKNADVTVWCEICNPFNDDANINLNVQIGGGYLSESILIPHNGNYEFDANFLLNDISLWDINCPNLYDVVISTGSDDLNDKIGFRKIEVNDTKIYLNGNAIIFKGVNRHEEHPDWGFAVPPNIIMRDLSILKDMHCNSVRGAHYPQSQTFLDYLDREGILFWSEIPMWGISSIESLSNPLTISRGLAMHKEMLEQYYHHPSIVIWGLHNEIDTETKEAYKITKLYSDYIRSYDESRLVTYATLKLEQDICLEFADFISLNYYWGWYKGTINDWEHFIKSIRAKMIEKGVGNKPVVMSEFGCAGLQGYEDFAHNKWTMQYQSDLLKKVIKCVFAEDGFCGTFVWHFADIRTNIDINRARGFNNKGILNEYRRPKTSYFTVKELYE